jgi:integrase
MPRARLTDDTIRKLPAADTGTVWYSDDKLPGFQLSIGTRSRTFYEIKSLHGRNIRKKLGEWPGVTAKAAREAAEQVRGLISTGVDPRRKKIATLDEALDDYIAYNTSPSRRKMSQATADSYKAIVRLHCARWRNRDLATITFEDLATLHKRLEDKPYTANHVVKLLRALFKHRRISMSIPKGFFYKEEKRENAITDLKDFGERVAMVDWAPKRAVWLMGAYTGIRRRSLTDLEWSNVDLDAGTIHLERMKNGLERTLPLSKPAIGVLKEMQGLNPKYVFPRRDNGGPIIEVRDDELPYVFHNTRNVFSEAAYSCLLPEPVIAYLRGDKLTQSMGQKYVTRLDLGVMREATDKIGIYLASYLQPA